MTLPHNSHELRDPVCGMAVQPDSPHQPLTEGKPKLMSVNSVGSVDESNLLRLAATLEKGSEHPLAEAIIKGAQEREIQIADAQNFEYVSGKGVAGDVDGRTVALGNRRLATPYV